ncbi:MAG: carbohydrate kinase [Chloroflexi bacterium]|nr:carbohydrate kinase [Chloroflexota bacterium]
MINVDVLCIGMTTYDLTFSVDRHPQMDEKLFASGFVGCGGGPAANAAMTMVRLGGTAVFSGYLGHDTFGDLHWQELVQAGVNTDWIVRGNDPTPIATIIAKPDGQRALVVYRGTTMPLAADAVDFTHLSPKLILFDGREPHLSLPLAQRAKQDGIPTMLDAGSVHFGTKLLMGEVDYLICSEKFACQFSGQTDENVALQQLSQHAPTVVVTVGARGVVWRHEGENGRLPAFPVHAIDSTGAGDTFHGAMAYALTQQMAWHDTLHFASAAAALCCTKYGARHGIPTLAAVRELLSRASTGSALV